MAGLGLFCRAGFWGPIRRGIQTPQNAVSQIYFSSVFAKTSWKQLRTRPEEIVALHLNVNAQYSSKSRPLAQVTTNAQVLGVEVRRILGRGVKILGMPG
jgi:hypothetical protein